MGALDGIIQLILYVCFGVYVVMGLSLTVMGVIYMSEVGAVGATGSYLIFFGLCMLIVGGIAIFANLKQIWLILFVIEIVNIFLFLGLYIAIIIVVMMASGSSDPIRRASEEAWAETTKQSLTIKGSAPDGSGGIYCQLEVEDGGCKPWYAAVKETKYKDCLDKSSKAQGVTLDATVNNCTALSDISPCGEIRKSCETCDLACKEQSIKDIKSQIVPASFFVLFLVVYFLVVIIWNNVMIGNDDLEGVSKIIGLVFNGILLLFALILTILGLVGYFSIECPKDSDCRPTSLVLLILLGVSTLGVSAVAVAGIQLNNNILLRVATLIMCFVAIFLIMAGIVMGMSSGAIMDDMNYYYDTQYPKLRAALEKADGGSPRYCQMAKADCTTLMETGKAVAVKDKDGVEVEGSTKITKAMMWKMQHYEAAKAADAKEPKAWLEVCKTTGICIYCDDFKKAAETFTLANENASIAPNINFQAAINGFMCKKGGSVTKPAKFAQFAHDSVWQRTPKDAKFVGIGCKDDETPVPRGWTLATTKKNTKAQDDAKGTAILASYKETTKQAKGDGATQAASESWQLLLRNHTRFAESPFWDTARGNKANNVNAAAKYVTKCEMAITNHATETKYCPDDAPDKDGVTLKTKKLLTGLKPDRTGDINVKASYVADCKSCRKSLGDEGMSFVVGGATTWSEDDKLNRCLNYFVGHMRTECEASDATKKCKCEDRFSSTKDTNKNCVQDEAAVKKHIKEMVDPAYTTTSAFCNYPDLQCKQKIQDAVESQMTTIAIFGVIFILFFLGIIFFTLQAIHIYRGGGDDDDDDDDDDE